MKSAFDRIVSVMAGRWLVLAWLAVSLACLATAYGYGRSHANDRWEARWEAAEGAARVAAARQEERWNGRASAAEQGLKDAQSEIDARDTQLGLLAGRVRELAARPRNLPPAAPGPAVPEPAPGGLDAVTIFDGIDRFARACAKSRDDLAAQVNGLIEAWPK